MPRDPCQGEGVFRRLPVTGIVSGPRPRGVDGPMQRLPTIVEAVGTREIRKLQAADTGGAIVEHFVGESAHLDPGKARSLEPFSWRQTEVAV